MAEAILAHRAAERGFDVSVDSAGTGQWHVGEPPDERTLAELVRNGMSASHTARRLVRGDAERFDVILVMDRDNHRETLRILGNEVADRVRMVLAPTTGADVPDPWSGGQRDFEAVFRMLDAAIELWLDVWTTQGARPSAQHA